MKNRKVNIANIRYWRSTERQYYCGGLGVYVLMDQKEKQAAKKSLGDAIVSIIKQNKESKIKNRISSLRKLAAASGVEYAIIQKVTSGKKDPQWTTIIALVEGLGISIEEFVTYL